MFRSLFGLDRSFAIAEMIARGALILDVRTRDEFLHGHVPGALNIPLEGLEQGMTALDRHRPIVTCCRSGIRAASAAVLLNGNGFMARNGGRWQRVLKLLP